jgi:hypothetical protein
MITRSIIRRLAKKRAFGHWPSEQARGIRSRAKSLAVFSGDSAGSIRDSGRMTGNSEVAELLPACRQYGHNGQNRRAVVLPRGRPPTSSKTLFGRRSGASSLPCFSRNRAHGPVVLVQALRIVATDQTLVGLALSLAGATQALQTREAKGQRRRGLCRSSPLRRQGLRQRMARQIRPNFRPK